MAKEAGNNLNGGFLSGLRSIFKETSENNDQVVSGTDFEALRDEFNGAINALKDKVTAHRSAKKRDSSEQLSTGGVGISNAESKKELLKKAYAAAKQAMYSEIEQLHKRYGTGVDSATLPALREFLLSAAELVSGQTSGDIETRLRAAAFIGVFKRAGEISWEVVNRLMHKVGDDWPYTHNLPDDASKEQQALERDRIVNDLCQTVLSSSPEAIAELTMGVVTAWTISYPARGSWLWKQVALRGVCAGIQAQITKEAAELLKSEGAAIRQEILALLASELNSIQASISKAGGSIEEMDRMIRTAGQILEGVVVDKALERARPVLERYLK